MISLVDSDDRYRAQLAAVILPEADLLLSDAVFSAGEASAAIERESPDILLLAIGQNHAETITLLEFLHSSKENIKVILLVLLESQDVFVKAVRAGCRGILHKDSPPDLLLKCIRKVHEGELWLDRATTAQLLRQLTEEQTVVSPRARDHKGSPLSPREREIAGLVVQGYKNKELAEKLAISEQTVKNHMHNIFDKLGVCDRLELALYAIHHRLLDPTS